MLVFKSKSHNEDIVILSDNILNIWKDGDEEITFKDVNNDSFSLQYETESERDNDYEKLKQLLSSNTVKSVVKNPPKPSVENAPKEAETRYVTIEPAMNLESLEDLLKKFGMNTTHE